MLLNHAGATISQDTGRDAQALANNLGLAVLAANRPGTSGFIPRISQRNNLAQAGGYVAETVALGQRIDRIAGNLGLKRLVIAGRSAGALGALALVRSESISTEQYLFAAEPPGCKTVDLEQGMRAFKEYNTLQKQLQQEEKGILVPPRSALPQPQATVRLAAIVKNVLYDRFHNSAIWASDATVEIGRYIAKHQPHIAATMSFAEHSLVTDEQTYYKNLLPIAELRTSGSPFVVDRIPRTTHASFDDRKFFAGLVRPMAERAIGTGY